MKVRYHYDNNFTQKPEEYSDLLLYQLGEMLCDSGNVVDSHTHLTTGLSLPLFSPETGQFTRTISRQRFPRETFTYLCRGKSIKSYPTTSNRCAFVSVPLTSRRRASSFLCSTTNQFSGWTNASAVFICRITPVIFRICWQRSTNARSIPIIFWNTN